MIFWFSKNFSRLELERSVVAELIVEGWFQLDKWLVYEGHLSVEGTILVGTISYPIRLIYPDQFPHVPAWVVPQDNTARWTSHQYGAGGPLCLEYRPDNWIQSFTGADVIRSTFALLTAENPLGDTTHVEVNSAHNISIIQSYDWYENALLIHPDCIQRILQGESSKLTALRWHSESSGVPILLTDEEFRLQYPIPSPTSVEEWGAYIPIIPICQEKPAHTIGNRDELSVIAGEMVNDQVFSDIPLLVLLIGDQNITGYHCPVGGEVFERRTIVFQDLQGTRSVRAGSFHQKKIAIVGVGSVGSKIAESLVRSGSKNMLLVDGDIFLPGNIERHILDWRDVGFRKVDRVKNKLMNIAVDATINTIAANLDWQRSASKQGSDIDALASCDLIIDATGDAGSTLMLGALAYENAKAFISVEVFEGGIGALIARSIPNIDPSYSYGRKLYNNFCIEQDTPPPTSGRRQYQSINYEGDPLIADDTAATSAASSAARVAIEILEDNIVEDTGSWILMGFKKAWLFNHHGHTICLDIGKPIQRDDELPSADTLKFLTQLIQDINEGNHTS